MPTLSRLSSIIEKIYSSVLSPTILPDVYDEIAQALGGIGAVVIPVGPGDNAPYISGTLTEAMEEYGAKWWNKDPGVEVARSRQHPPGVYATEDIVDAEVMRTHPIYTEFGPRYGFRYFLSMTIAPRPDIYLIVSVQRPVNAGPATARERRTAELLRTHLSRSTLMRHQIEHFNRTADAIMDRLSNATNGTAIISPDKTVLFHNAAMGEMQDLGLAVVGGRLKASTGASQAKLDKILERCIAMDPAEQNDRTVIDTLVVPDRLPLVVRAAQFVAPEDSHAMLFRDLRDFILLTVVDPNGTARSNRPIGELRLLGLSMQEARIVVLVAAGLSPQEAAKDMGISISTARTYLKSVFEKLSVKSQVQLASLVARLR